MKFVICAVVLQCFMFTCLYASEQPTVVTVTSVYKKNLKTYSAEGKPLGRLLSKDFLGAEVQRFGESNDVGLIEVSLPNGSRVWIKPSHVKTSKTGRVCKAIELAVAAGSSMAPVSSGWETKCDE